MTIKEAKKLKDHDYVTDGIRFYLLRIFHSNQNDYWFWQCRKNSKELIRRGGGIITRVYLGSKNLKPNNLEFLSKLQPE